MYRDGRDAALARVHAAEARWRECAGSNEGDAAAIDLGRASITSMLAAAEAYEARTAHARPRAPNAPPDPLTIAKRNYGAALSEWYSLARRLRQSRTRILAEAAARRRRVDIDGMLRNRPRPPCEDETAYRLATQRAIATLERMRDLLEPDRRSQNDCDQRNRDAERAHRAHQQRLSARLRSERERVSVTLILIALGSLVTLAFACVASLAGVPPWAGIAFALYFGLTIPASLAREKSGT